MIGVIGLLVTTVLLLQQSGVTIEAYGKIKIGMTRQQVEKIFGCPSLGKAREGEPNIYSGGYHHMAFNFGKEGDLWRSSTLRVWIFFTPEDWVTGIGGDFFRQPAKE